MESFKHVFIVNPEAGPENCVFEIAAFAKQIKENGYPLCDLKVAKHFGDVERFAKEATDEATDANFTVIYACGGDGTLNLAVNGVMRGKFPRRVAVTHIPRGSGNDFIKSFARPELFPKTHQELDAFFSNEILIKPVDLLKVNDRYCINICSVGLDARIANGMNEFRKSSLLGGKMAYHASVAKNLFKDAVQTYGIEIDGGVFFTNLLMICVCNGSWYGGSYNPVPTAKPDDGIMDILLVNQMSKISMPFVIGDYKKGNFAYHPNLISHYTTSNEVRISPFKLECVNMDGEISTAGEVRVNLVPKAINFLAPKKAW